MIFLISSFDAPVAATNKHYKDLTPPGWLVVQDFVAPPFHTGKRLSKTGRSIKRQRRNMDDVMNEAKLLETI